MDMLSFYFYLPAVASLAAIYVLTSHFLHRLHGLPPTPFPCLPIIGHLYLLRAPFHMALQKISKRHGPLVYLRFGSRPILVVSSPSAVDECLNGQNDVNFANRPPFLFGKYFGYNFTSMAWSSYGDHWRNLRRLSSLEVLSSHRIQMLSYVRVEEVQALIRKLYYDSLENPNKVLDMKSTLFELTYNIMTRMIMGKTYYGDYKNTGAATREEVKLFQNLVEETARIKSRASLLDLLPLMRWFGLQNVESELRRIQQKRDNFMQSLVEEHRGATKSIITHNEASSIGKKGKSMIQVLLDLHETDAEYYKDELIRNLILVLLQAGSDTSAGTLEHAFKLLLDNVCCLKQAQSDIDNLVRGQDRLISESDLATRLPYIQNIIDETLRLHPPAPLLMPHRSAQECRVGGYRIPANTILLVNAWGIHHDPKVWDEPETFKPDRFQPKVGSNNKFIPFGSGRRGCPGENLAHRVIGLALGSLIQCFDWEKVTSTSNCDMREVQPLMARCYPRPNTATLFSH